MKPNCECTHFFTCRACCDRCVARNLADKNSGAWMRVDFTCGCGLYVHPDNPRTNPAAIHIADCTYWRK